MTWTWQLTGGLTSSTWCWSASGRIRLTASATTSATATGSSDSGSRPASMAAMSSTSLIKASRCRAAFRMKWRFSFCSSVRSSSSSSWANPRMAFSGVRSSWLIRDRYSLLAAFALSAASLASRSSMERCRTSSSTRALRSRRSAARCSWAVPSCSRRTTSVTSSTLWMM